MNFRLVSAATIALVLLASHGVAADQPDMNGTWVLDAKSSDFGNTPVPQDLVLKIKVSGPDFHVSQTGGPQGQIDLRFNTEGKEVTNDLPGAKMTSKHHWDAGVLVGDIKITAEDGNTVTFKDRTSFSSDGKVQTLERRVSGRWAMAR